MPEIAQMSDAIRKAAALLLVLVLGVAACGDPIEKLAVIASFSCQCCKVDKDACPTRACCRAQRSEEKPASPLSAASRAGSELQLLAATSTPLFRLRPDTVHDLPPAPHSIQASAVPIFQRDCSYLI